MTSLVTMTVSGDRHLYLEQALASWLSVRGRDRWSFRFCVEPGHQLHDSLRVIGDFAEHAKAEVSTVVNYRRFGVLENPFRAFDYGFSQGHEFVVLAEEDVVVSNDVLEYFEHFRDHLCDDATVLGVCAFSSSPVGGSPTAVGPAPFSPLTWGTWSDRWWRLLGPRWFSAAEGPTPGVQSGWDWGVNRILSAEEMRVFGPTVSRADHIGEFGVHSRPEMFKSTTAPSFVPHRDSVVFS